LAGPAAGELGEEFSEDVIDGAHILIADDVEDVRSLVRFHLEREGFRVSEAAGGREALELLHSDTPDVLLLDLTMPDVDGWQVLEEAGANGLLNGVRIALLTGDADEVVERRGRKAGADVYLVKPLDASDLTRAVRRLLAEDDDAS
jgi:DNA-binding response OmpR family regulator